MPEICTDKLKQLHQLMNEMLTAAQNGDWTLVTTMDSQRRELLNITPVNGGTKDDSPQELSSEQLGVRPEQQALVDQILDLDSRIVKTLVDAKETLVLENREFSAQKHAAAGYAQASAFI